MKKNSKDWSFRKIECIIVFAFLIGYLFKFRHWPSYSFFFNIKSAFQFILIFGTFICVAVFLIMERREKARKEDRDEDE